MNFRLARPAILIDLNRVPGLRGLARAADGGLVAGAMTRHSDFEFSPLARELLPVAHAAMPAIAHRAIRNRGTLGGSLAHADPAADWPALCLACDAQMTVRSRSGARTVAARGFARGLFETALRPGEMLTEVAFPAWERARRWGLQKMTRRQGDFAIVGVVVVAAADGEGRSTGLRVVVYGAAECAQLVPAAAEVLEGRPPTGARIDAAARAAAGAVPTRSDLHASSAYRSELVQTLVRRALLQAFPEAAVRAAAA